MRKGELINEWKSEVAVSKFFALVTIITIMVWFAGYENDFVSSLMTFSCTFWVASSRLARRGLEQAEFLERIHFEGR